MKKARLLPGVVLACLAAQTALGTVLPAHAQTAESAPFSFSASPTARVPLIGLDGPQQDACVGIARVSLFGAEGRNPLAVREKPSRFAKQAGALEPGELVWLCEAEGDFQGIVYAGAEFQQLGDCRLGRPMAEPEPYSGPCATGWVEAARLQLVTDR